MGEFGNEINVFSYVWWLAETFVTALPGIIALIMIRRQWAKLD